MSRRVPGSILALLYVGLGILFVLESCKSSSSIENPTSTYLLRNSNFDSASTHGFNGWTFHKAAPDDTTDFELDSPPVGGLWSFKLHTSDDTPFTNNITRVFTNLGSGIYSLTVWSHTKYVFSDSIAPANWMQITKLHTSISSVTRHDFSDSLLWHPETLLDTLDLQPTDSIELEISAGLLGLHGNPITVNDITFAKQH